MSDEAPRPVIGTDIEPARPQNAGGLFEHYCEHPACKQWGAFEFPKGTRETIWFCFEHRLLT